MRVRLRQQLSMVPPTTPTTLALRVLRMQRVFLRATTTTIGAVTALYGSTTAFTG